MQSAHETTASCRQGKVEQVHLNANKDTVFYLIQEITKNSTSNLLDLLYFGHLSCFTI